MVIARYFWALIKFMAAYLLAYAIAHLLALDMLVMSYIRRALYLVKFLVFDFPFSSSAICFLSALILLLS